MTHNPELVEMVAQAIWKQRGLEWPPQNVCRKEDATDEAEAALNALAAAGRLVADNHVTVPIQPTAHMKNVAADLGEGYGLNSFQVLLLWQPLLKAAQHQENHPDDTI